MYSLSRRAALASVPLIISASLLTGCSSSDSSKDSASSGATTLKMWTFKQSHVPALQQLAATFKAQSGISVDVTAVTPDDSFYQRLQAGAKTGDLPDTIEVHAGSNDFTLGAAGILDDLSKDFDATKRGRFLTGIGDTGLVTPAVEEKSKKSGSPWTGVKAGALHSVPFTAGTFGIVYANKDKLTAAGVDTTAGPKTWSQFVAALQKTTAKDKQGGGLSLGLKVSQTGFNWVYQPMAYAQLGKQRYQQLFGKDAATSFSSADGLRTLNTYNQLAPYWIPGATTLGIDDADLAFTQGKSAFDVGGTFTLAFLTQNGMAADKIMAFPMPVPDDAVVKDRGLAPIALTGLGITTATKHREAAIKWLDFLTTAQNAGAFAKTSLDLPGTVLGADAATLLGPQLAGMQKVFAGTSDSLWNPGDISFFPASYDQVKAGDIVVKMSPLKKETPEQTGPALTKLFGDFWRG